MTDVLTLLRDANPVPDPPAHPRQDLQSRIDRARAAGSEPVVRQLGNRPTKRRLVVLAASTTSLVALGLGSAAAAGWFSPDVREAFSGADDPSGAGPAHPGTTREEVTRPGPEGTRMGLWDESVGPRGACYSIIVDRRSADLIPSVNKPFHQGASCGSQRSTSTFGTVEESSWRSPATGQLYRLYAGPTGTADGFEIRIPGKAALRAVISNGYFLLPPLPEQDRQQARLVALDARGNVIVVNGQADMFLGDIPGPG